MPTPISQGGTLKDYENLSPTGIQSNNPKLRFNPMEDIKGHLDMNDPAFRQVYDKADLGTKREMLNSNNNSHALKVAEMRKIQKEAEENTANDSWYKSLGYSAYTNLVTPASVLLAVPGGAVVRASTMARSASMLVNSFKVGLAFGGVGTAMALGDEYTKDIQGLETNYISAGTGSLIFGGGLGLLTGGLMRTGLPVAKAIVSEGDEYAPHFRNDPDIKIEYDENGIIKLQDIGQMEKSLIDRIPFIGKYLRSDVHTVYQSDSPILRSLMARIETASVSQMDSEGNRIAVSMTGSNDKTRLRGVLNTLTNDIERLLGKAIESGEFKNAKEFDSAINTVYFEALTRQNREAHAYANLMTKDMKTSNLTDKERTALRKAYKDAYNEWLENNEIDFRGSPTSVEGAKAYRQYYDTMYKEGMKRGVKGLGEVNPKKLYGPRYYNRKAVHSGKVSMEEAKTMFRNAFTNAPENEHLSKADMDTLVDSAYADFMSSVFDLNKTNNSYMVNNLPFGHHLYGRKYYLDEPSMKGLLNTSMGEVAGMYHYKMSGRYATQFAFGTEDLASIMKLVEDEHLARGIVNNQEEIQAFERTVKDLLGDLRMNSLSNTPSWTFTRNLTSFNAARLMGGAGGNQFIELMAAITMSGIRHIFSSGIGRSLKDTKNILFTKGKATSDVSEMILASGFLSDSLHTNRINRYTDVEYGFNSGTLEKGLGWLNETQQKYNGQKYFTGVAENYVGGALLSKLRTGALKEAEMYRLGLTPEDYQSLRQDVLNHYNPKEGKLDLEKFSQENRDKLQMVIIRGISEMVIQPDSLHLPSWMKVPTQLNHLLFQFMRFPLIAQETLLRRGFTESKAEMVVGVLASITGYMAEKYLREQAAVALNLKKRKDMKYDYSKDKDFERALQEAIGYSAPLGFMSNVYNYGAVIAGFNELGRDWQDKKGMPSLLGPSYGLGEDVIQIIRDLKDGSIDDTKTKERARALMPWQGLPIINEGIRTLMDNHY